MYKAKIMRRVKEIPYKQGSGHWLSKFVSIMWQCGFISLEVYSLTPDTVFELKYIARDLQHDGWCCVDEKNLSVLKFLKEHKYIIKQDRFKSAMVYVKHGNISEAALKRIDSYKDWEGK